MRVPKTAKDLLARVGLHLVAVSAQFNQIPEETMSTKEQLEALKTHLATTGKALAAGDLKVLGVDESVPKPTKKAPSEDGPEPDLCFYSLPEDLDATAPVIVDVKGEVRALVCGPRGLAIAIKALCESEGLDADEFGLYPGLRPNFTEPEDGPGVVFDIPSFLAKHEANMTKKAAKAYKKWPWKAIEGFEYASVPEGDRKLRSPSRNVASSAAKERAAARAKLDEGRPYTKEALEAMGKADLMTVASLCGLDPRKITPSKMVTGIIKADKDMKRSPTLEEITQGLSEMDASALRELAKEENIDMSPLEAADEGQLRDALTAHLTNKYTANPSEEVAF